MAKAKDSKIADDSAKRKNIRFEPDIEAFAYIDLSIDKKDFQPKISALIIDESFKGAALVLRANEIIKPGVKMQVMPGRIGPLLAEVKWLKNHGIKIIEIGIQYLE